MLQEILGQTTSLTVTLSQQLHTAYVPYPVLQCLHAVRISIACHAIARSRLGPGQKDTRTILNDLTAFLMMSWGGGMAVHYMLNLTPPQLLAFPLWTNYLGIHLLCKFLFVYLGVSLPPAYMLDLIFPFIDGATRAGAVFGTISLLANHPIKPYQQSLLLQVILGTISASGGGELAGTLDVFNPNGWTLQTPPLLRARTLVQFIDILAPLCGTIGFGLATYNHPSYGPVLSWMSGNNKAQATLNVDQGRALVVLIITAFFALRAVLLHYPKLAGSAPMTRVKAKSS